VQAFANAPKPDNAVDNPVQVIAFNIENQDASLSIAGKHAYYSVPLGQASADAMWHSAIHCETTTTSAFRANYKKLPGTQSVWNKEVETPTQGGVDVWLVSLTVQWTSAAYAQQIYQTFMDLWTATYPEYAISYYNPLGSEWQLKIKAPQGISPAQVRAAVKDIGQQTIQQALAIAIPKPKASGGLAPPAIAIPPPDVEVTNSAIILSTS